MDYLKSVQLGVDEGEDGARQLRGCRVIVHLNSCLVGLSLALPLALRARLEFFDPSFQGVLEILISAPKMGSKIN